MTAYEIMLSESQERMLMILKPGSEAEAKRIFDKWELDFAVIGRVTETGKLVLTMHGETVAELPVEPLVTQAPQYERPWVAPPAPPEFDSEALKQPEDFGTALKTLLGCPDLAGKAWITDQYDKNVMADTVLASGGADAALVRVHGTSKGLALTADCTPRYCAADPREGGAQAVAESWRNLTAIGATPLAITDNMNFGNPEKPAIMGQFALAIEGMRNACLALDYPVVSGNVSLYNETEGQAIQPTPAIGGVGLIEDVTKAVPLGFSEPGLAILLIGATNGHLGQSLYLREVHGMEAGAPPPVDLAAERRNGDFVRRLILAGRVAACHDLSDGGLAVALSEMAMARGIGATIDTLPEGVRMDEAWFGEDQGRYLLAVRDPAPVLVGALGDCVPVLRLGTTGGAALEGPGLQPIPVAELKRLNDAWLPAYMAEEA